MTHCKVQLTVNGVLAALFILVLSISALARLLALAASVLRIVARAASLWWRLFGLLRLGLPILLRTLLLINCLPPLGLLLLALLLPLLLPLRPRWFAALAAAGVVLRIKIPLRGGFLWPVAVVIGSDRMLFLYSARIAIARILALVDW